MADHDDDQRRVAGDLAAGRKLCGCFGCAAGVCGAATRIADALRAARAEGGRAQRNADVAAVAAFVGAFPDAPRANIAPALAAIPLLAPQPGGANAADPVRLDDLRLLDSVLGAAEHCARKLETMYKRGESTRRAELDGLIDLLGGHDIPGEYGYQQPTQRRAVRDAWKRVYNSLRSSALGADAAPAGDGGASDGE